MKKLFQLAIILLISIITTKTWAQAYFQQEVNYKIDVKLNDKKHELSAYESIEYLNNSPSELTFIYFHLWPNAYDNNNTALAKQKLNYGRPRKLFNDPILRGYVDSLDFKVDGEKVKVEIDPQYIDICKIILNRPLKSNEKVTITTPFHVKIPKGVTSRLGHIDESYQISQWYPKPAVYDIYGWHQMPYLNLGEFYSEFGSFDVSITLPENYVVGATGDLQTQSEIEWLNQLAENTSKLTSYNKKDVSFPVSSSKTKTIRYVQHNVHDFAWFADKRFHVLKSEITLPISQRKVTTWAMFTNEDADLWLKATDYINDAIGIYSSHYGEYPYDVCTAVMSALSAGGGMEYPNITVIGRTGNPRELEMVIMHEVGHNWFYGFFGFNEREFAWQDEGINSFAEARYMKEKYGENDGLFKETKEPKLVHFFGLDFRYNMYQENGYLLSARRGMDQPCSLTATDYLEMNYGVIVYMKTGRVINYLMTYLGEQEFDRIMHKFYDEWKFKHPYPENIQKLFEKETGKDLSWVFNDLLKTTKRVDYKVEKVKNNQLTVKNVGRISSPLFISGLRNGKAVYTKTYEGFEGKKQLDLPDSTGVNKISLDYNSGMTEFNRKNNTIRTSGIFKKTEPIRFKLAGIIENPEKTQINFIPTAGWNNYDKAMLGLALYSNIIPQNQFEYTIMPMYSFGTNDLAGSANLAYHILPYSDLIQSIDLSLSGLQYAYESTNGKNFQKVKGQVDFVFRKHAYKPVVSNNLMFNTIYASDVHDIVADTSVGYTQFFNLRFDHRNGNIFFPFNYSAAIQGHKDFAKTTLTANYKINFQNGKGINFRFFGGAFLYKTKNLSPLYDFKLSGTTGAEDYTFNEIFLGRYENAGSPGLLSNQFIANEGGFATYSPFGHTNDWLTSLTMTVDVPGPKKNILAIYGSIATYGNTRDVIGYANPAKYEWEAGIKFSMNNILDIYLPVFMSSDLNKFSDDITKRYTDRIRFSINLNSLNPRNLVNNMF